MDFYPEKKIEIICEGAVADRLLSVIESLGAHGYTVMPTIKGRGDAGHQREAFLDRNLNNVLILSIVNAETATRIIEEIYPTLQAHSGIIYVSDVHVLRPERF